MNFNEFTDRMKNSDNKLLIEAIQNGYNSIFEGRSGKDIVYDVFDYFEDSEFDEVIDDYDLSDKENARKLINDFNRRILTTWTPGYKNAANMYAISTIADQLKPLARGNYMASQIGRGLLHVYREIDERFAEAKNRLPKSINIPDGVPYDDFKTTIDVVVSMHNSYEPLTIDDINKGTEAALKLIEMNKSQSPNPNKDTGDGRALMRVSHTDKMSRDVQNGSHPLHKQWRRLSRIDARFPAVIMKHLAN